MVAPESRSLCRRGSAPAERSSGPRPAQGGRGGGRGVADRCRDPVLPFPAASSVAASLHPPSPWARRDAPRESYNFPETSPGLGKLQRVPALRVQRAARWPGAAGGRSVRDGGLRLVPAVRRRPATPAPLRSLGLAPALAPARTTLCDPRSATSNAAVLGGAVGDAAARGWYQAGQRRGAPRAGCRGPGRNRSLFLDSYQTVDPVRSQVTQASDLCAALLSETSREYGVCDLVPPLLEMKLAYGVD